MNLTDFSTDLILFVIVLVVLIVSAVLAVVIRDLLKAAIVLGAASAVLTIIMFAMGSYLAAVFELSVCAGLITVIFISAISLTKPKTHEEYAALAKQRLKRFVYLPALLVVAAAILFAFRPYFNIDWITEPVKSGLTVRDVIWGVRQTDMLGQVIIILAGVFGVVILFKERGTK